MENEIETILKTEKVEEPKAPRRPRAKKTQQAPPAETKVVEPKAVEDTDPISSSKPQPEPESEPISKPKIKEKEAKEVSLVARKSRSLLIRPMKQKPKNPGRPGRGQRKAL